MHYFFMTERTYKVDSQYKFKYLTRKWTVASRKVYKSSISIFSFTYLSTSPSVLLRDVQVLGHWWCISLSKSSADTLEKLKKLLQKV